jgi:hypothetical protein
VGGVLGFGDGHAIEFDLVDGEFVAHPVPGEPSAPANPRWRSVRRASRIRVALASTALITAVLLIRNLSAPGPPERPQPPPAPTILAVAPPGEGHSGQPLELGSGRPVALTLDETNDRLDVLLDQPPRLVSRAGTGQLSSRPVPSNPVALLEDDASRQLWVIAQVAADSVITSYDPVTLTENSVARIRATFNAAVVMDGKLFIAVSDGIYELRRGSGLVRLLDPQGRTMRSSVLVADPSNHRLIFSTAGSSARLSAIHPGGAGVHDGPLLAHANVSVAVAVSQLWIVSDPGEPEITRHLDTNDLFDSRASGAASGLSAHGASVWPGHYVIWVHSAAEGTLSCLDAVTGHVLVQWSQITGPVASTSGGLALAYAIDKGTVVPLDTLSTCQG